MAGLTIDKERWRIMEENREVTVIDKESHSVTFAVMETVGTTYYHYRVTSPGGDPDVQTTRKKVDKDSVHIVDGFQFDLYHAYVDHQRRLHEWGREYGQVEGQAIQEENLKVADRVEKKMRQWRAEHPEPTPPTYGLEGEEQTESGDPGAVPEEDPSWKSS